MERLHRLTQRWDEELKAGEEKKIAYTVNTTW